MWQKEKIEKIFVCLFLSKMYKVYSTAYLSHDVSSYTCVVNEKEWISLHNDFSTSKMFVRIMKDDRFWICALDSPIHDAADNCIYVPSWMLDQIGCGDGETMHVEFMPTEAFDHSEKIVLQAWQDNDIGDIQELLSNELTKLAILQKGTNICVNVYGMDLNYTIVDLEPASVVLCEGDEVELEFYEERPLPTAPVLEPEPVREPEPVKESVRFNPWRNKDFKPYMS